MSVNVQRPKDGFKTSNQTGDQPPIRNACALLNFSAFKLRMVSNYIRAKLATTARGGISPLTRFAYGLRKYACY